MSQTPEAVSDLGLRCPKCGYNLTGITSSRCPECGQPFSLDSRQSEQAVPVLAFRLLGVFLIVLHMDIGYTFTYYAMSAPMESVAIGFASLMALGASIAVTAAARPLARWLVPEGIALERRRPRLLHWQAMGFSLIGVWLVATAVPSLAYALAILSELDRIAWIDLAYPLAQVLVGVALFFGARSLTNLWHTLRTVGTTN